uniref:bifunctional metallophosphatase/5'-nucleotidase n=1 Tax=Flavobacterium sp. TaxID=239 RepID=UPI00404A8A15
MQRRKFIFNTLSTLTYAGLGGFSSLEKWQKDQTKITILHTNDVHSHIDPFPLNHPRNPGAGGVAKRAQIIKDIRAESEHVLLLDAGDSFQGTPYFNYYGGEIEWKLMSMMGYDATTIGNHEFDSGLQNILAQIPHAKFDILSANYDFSNTVLDTFIKPYRIFNKGNVKIGVFGLGVELDGLVDKKLYLETVYNNPLEVAQTITNQLKTIEKCDLVICLSHLGYYYKNEPTKICDLQLAEKSKDIDIIIGGHTHTFLDKPTLVQNANDQTVVVNQVGCYGLNLGRIDVFFDKTKTTASKSRIITV